MKIILSCLLTLIPTICSAETTMAKFHEISCYVNNNGKQSCDRHVVVELDKVVEFYFFTKNNTYILKGKEVGKNEDGSYFFQMKSIMVNGVESKVTGECMSNIKDNQTFCQMSNHIKIDSHAILQSVVIDGHEQIIGDSL